MPGALTLPDIEIQCRAVRERHVMLSVQLARQKDLMETLTGTIRPAAEDAPIGELTGHVVDVSGLCVTVDGLASFTAVGDQIRIRTLDGRDILAEIIAFRHGQALAMTYESIEGIGAGCPVFHELHGQGRQGLSGGLAVNESWIGRVVDPMGQPLDGRGPLLPSAARQQRHARPPEAAGRARLGARIDLGIKALNLFTTCRQGQRLGLFAGSGVGKSTLMGMLARETACDVTVISLVGERGREVREFMEDDLGPEGLAKSVLVVATSDSSALMRREAAYSAMAVAEHFRNQGKSVLLLMDSVTRFCQALREIGLSAGEVPATRGYPPSVFATLPRLLERAGPGALDEQGQAGQMTAFFSVLVEGDDQNEPVTDTVRGILDGHVVLERSIAESGRYPAINVLRSLSRSVPGCNSESENELTVRARRLLSQWDEVRDLVRLGAYKAGNDPEADLAVQLGPQLEEFLIQKKTERVSLEDSFAGLRELLSQGERVEAHPA
ncbi:Flagellum-specific ATP synthase FliI [Parasaccharibacter apium]|uniref:Flagellum-specific ATP synthase n=2 Tax=Acetobacterales TaxID=3120395 RepID=A0A7U7G4L4_9PROT|nr:Flagellum-specific ATP synthase FliI [Parasaccharibacter apium]